MIENIQNLKQILKENSKKDLSIKSNIYSEKFKKKEIENLYYEYQNKISNSRLIKYLYRFFYRFFIFFIIL